jgi:hypothetical protein
MLFAASHPLLLFSVYPSLYKTISEAQALSGNEGMRHVRLTGTSSSCWGGENPLKSSAKAAAAEADTQKSLNQETVTNRFSEEKNSPERTATKLPNGTDFLSLSLSPSLSLLLTQPGIWNNKQKETCTKDEQGS